MGPTPGPPDSIRPPPTPQPTPPPSTPLQPTQPQPTTDGVQQPPTPPTTETPFGTRVDLSDFTAQYALPRSRDASESEVMELVVVTTDFLDDVFQNLFAPTEMVDYEGFILGGDAEPNVNNVIPVEYTVAAFFIDTDSTVVPTQAQLDGILVESLQSDEYLTELGSLATNNVFRLTTKITIPPTGDAKILEVGDEQTQGENDDDSSGTNSVLIASITSVSVVAVAIAAVFVIRKKRKGEKGSDASISKYDELENADNTLDEQSSPVSIDDAQEESRSKPPLSFLKKLFMINEEPNEDEEEDNDITEKENWGLGLSASKEGSLMPGPEDAFRDVELSSPADDQEDYNPGLMGQL